MDDARTCAQLQSPGTRAQPLHARYAGTTALLLYKGLGAPPEDDADAAAVFRDIFVYCCMGLSFVGIVAVGGAWVYFQNVLPKRDTFQYGTLTNEV